jgi:precorrin-2 dehydrogenase / sirohydrochlorin ferrochelatase
MKYYPIFLDLSTHPCLVIGGGTVAERKVETLLSAQGKVTVISPTLTPQLHARAKDRVITVFQRPYRAGDLKGFSLVFVATDDAELHKHVADEAREAGVLLNVADQPEFCSFIVPAIVARGDLTIAVSTGGASPALARKIRHDLERSYGLEYELTLRVLARVREWVAKSQLTVDERRRLFTTLVESPLVEYVRERQIEKIDALLQQTVGKSCTLEGLGLSL